MLKLILFLASMPMTSETRQILTCKTLLSGVFCLPGSEAVPESMKSLENFSLWGFQRFLMQTGNREMKTKVEEQKVEKRKNRIKDSRIRILKRTQVEEQQIEKSTNRVKDSRIRILRRPQDSVGN